METIFFAFAFDETTIFTPVHALKFDAMCEYLSGLGFLKTSEGEPFENGLGVTFTRTAKSGFPEMCFDRTDTVIVHKYNTLIV